MTTCIRVRRGAVLVPTHTHPHPMCPIHRAVIVLPSDCHPSAHAHLWCAPVWDLHGPAYQIAVRIHPRVAGTGTRARRHIEIDMRKTWLCCLAARCGAITQYTHTHTFAHVHVCASSVWVWVYARALARTLAPAMMDYPTCPPHAHARSRVCKLHMHYMMMMLNCILPRVVRVGRRTLAGAK